MSYATKALLISGLALFSFNPLAMAEATADETLARLNEIIAARSADSKTRDAARHPAATLSFFQVSPGMTIAEALPGGGWYSQILAPYLGAEGALYGVNYVEEMWSMFGFMNEEQVKARIASTKAFPAKVAQFTDNGISVQGFTFNSVPQDTYGTVDRVLIIRALHNLNRFEARAGTRSQALAAVRVMLKDDGLVGVVQHRLGEAADDAGADGSRGYLKQSAVVVMFEQAGFELVSTSEINANPKDKPGPQDIVWRLPPSFNDSKDNPERHAAMQAIGESDRMTLLFKKAGG